MSLPPLFLHEETSPVCWFPSLKTPVSSGSQWFKEKNSEISVNSKAFIDPQTAPVPSPSKANLIHFFYYPWHTVIGIHFPLQYVFPFPSVADFIPHSKSFLMLFSHWECPPFQPSKFCHLPLSLLIHFVPHLWLYQPTLISSLNFYTFFAYMTNFGLLCSFWLFVLEAPLWVLNFLLLPL